MLWRDFFSSDRFARYFFTLVVGNNIIGLFLTLSMYQEGVHNFFALLILVLAIAYPTSLVCLIAIDVVFFLAKRFGKEPPSFLLVIALVALVQFPALWIGFRVGAFIAPFIGIKTQLTFTDVARPGLLFGLLVMSLSWIFNYWLQNLRLRYEQQAALLGAERRIVQARFDLLAKELHPHLLFNVIQNVLSLMASDSAAKKMLEELAVYYQDVLLVIDKNAIGLSEEIALCRRYMVLQQSRFKQLALVVTDKTMDRFDNMLLPPLLLQPLLENAVKFAMASEGSDKTIRIIIEEGKAYVHIAIINPKSPHAKAKPGFSKGLKNSEQRMKDFFGDSARLTLLQFEESTSVTLDLPYAQQTTH